MEHDHFRINLSDELIERCRELLRNNQPIVLYNICHGGLITNNDEPRRYRPVLPLIHIVRSGDSADKTLLEKISSSRFKDDVKKVYHLDMLKYFRFGLAEIFQRKALEKELKGSVVEEPENFEPKIYFEDTQAFDINISYKYETIQYYFCMGLYLEENMIEVITRSPHLKKKVKAEEVDLLKQKYNDYNDKHSFVLTKNTKRFPLSYLIHMLYSQLKTRIPELERTDILIVQMSCKHDIRPILRRTQSDLRSKDEFFKAVFPPHMGEVGDNNEVDVEGEEEMNGVAAAGEIAAGVIDVDDVGGEEEMNGVAAAGAGGDEDKFVSIVVNARMKLRNGESLRKNIITVVNDERVMRDRISRFDKSETNVFRGFLGERYKFYNKNKNSLELLYQVAVLLHSITKNTDPHASFSRRFYDLYESRVRSGLSFEAFKEELLRNPLRAEEVILYLSELL